MLLVIKSGTFFNSALVAAIDDFSCVYAVACNTVHFIDGNILFNYLRGSVADLHHCICIWIRIRILLFTFMWIRILPFTLIRIASK
jgi:hypothetical protein